MIKYKIESIKTEKEYKKVIARQAFIPIRFTLGYPDTVVILPGEIGRMSVKGKMTRFIYNV